MHVMRIRPFSPSDVEPVSGIVREALRENYPPSLYFDLYHWWREGFIVAENSGQVIGFIAGVVPQPGQARILMLAVEEAHRNRGIGTQLMNSFVGVCAMRGMKSVELEVRQSNVGGISFYKRHGFQLMHSLEKFYTDGEDGYKMMKHL